MIKKIDKYIIKKYLSTFFFTMLIFSMISVIIDFSNNIEDFIEEDVTIYQIVFEYYLNWMLWINGLLIPLYALIAVIFFTSRMAYDSEIISIFNAGVSFRRLMVPYLMAGGFITILHLLGNHYFIPIGNKIHYDFQHQYIWKHNDKGKTSDVHLFIGPETTAYIKYYRKQDSTARDVKIERYQDHSLVYILKARLAEWQGPPNHWKLKDYEIRTFDGLKETIVLGKKEEMDTTINITPADFVEYINQQEMLPTFQLMDYIDTQERRGINNTKRYRVELHRRTSEPFTILILTIIGMAIAARKVRGGIGLHLAVGVGLGASYIFLSKFSATFATNESLPPIIGVWFPNIVFAIIAIWLVSKAQK
ncbi:MAG: lipopolysaccharide export system permease protein [Saprospiraceae bacterium]|jgi:lipopolysaccharide export system permease protein